MVLAFLLNTVVHAFANEPLRTEQRRNKNEVDEMAINIELVGAKC